MRSDEKEKDFQRDKIKINVYNQKSLELSTSLNIF